jgi:predicted ABC-type ATPase
VRIQEHGAVPCRLVMALAAPTLVVIGGPNGAGKSTVAPFLLREELSVAEFVNADVIAQELSPSNAARAAIEAGRIMIRRIEELTRRRIDFAFESTLASRMLAERIDRARTEGYSVALAFLWLSGPEVAVQRVRERAIHGGHSVPEETIRRRYRRGIDHFFRIYRPLADVWRFYDNSLVGGPRLVAWGSRDDDEEILDEEIWRTARSGA